MSYSTLTQKRQNQQRIEKTMRSERIEPKLVELNNNFSNMHRKLETKEYFE